MRRDQHKKDLRLSLILIVNVFVFIMFHLPRVVISVYEAFTTQQMVICGKKGRAYYHIWYLYVQLIAQLLQVRAKIKMCSTFAQLYVTGC